MKDFLSINDINNDQLESLLEIASDYRRGVYNDKPLSGESIALIFEKPSLRTFVSFDVGIYEMGGHPIYLKGEDIGLDVREPVEDVARVLERWCSVIVARVFSHRTLTRLAAISKKKVYSDLFDSAFNYCCEAF